MIRKAQSALIRGIARGFTGKGNKSNTLWKMEHMNDPYVKEAQRLDLRSRAAFKLKEINMRYNIIKKDNIVVDLGSSPGGWTQACLEIISTPTKKFQVYAMDIIQMDYLHGSKFLLGDITNGEDILKLQLLMELNQADVVLSDIAPNITGERNYDTYHIERLNGFVICAANRLLRPGGHLLMKTFNSSEEKGTFKFMETMFKETYRVKPQASRKRSPELYFLGKLR